MTGTPLARAAEDYVAMRRSFGYKLHGHDRLLADFCAWLERGGLDTVTIDAAAAWAVEPQASASWHAERLRAVRGFATYLHALDARCQVPPRDLLPAGHRRVPPHIYSPEQLDDLTAQARLLRPPLRAATFETLLGLLVVTGIRSGEALRLNRDDLDPEAGTATVVASKFNRSRQLAVHSSTVHALVGSPNSATGVGRSRAPRASSCPTAAGGSATPASTKASISYSAGPAWSHRSARDNAAPGRMTPGTALRCHP